MTLSVLTISRSPNYWKSWILRHSFGGPCCWDYSRRNWAFTSNTIVDSGTNVLLQRTSNFNRITNEIISQMCTPPNVFDGPGVCDNGNNFFNQTCYPYTPAQRAAFPSVSLIVDSATLTMQGPDYVVPNGTTGFFCYGIKDTGEVGLDIIGDVVMQVEFFFLVTTQIIIQTKEKPNHKLTRIDY